jgi:hypothetical protein
MSYEESFEMIHPDDRHIYMEFIKRLANGEKETDECIFRWDMSGEKRLGQWRYMEDQGIAEYANAAGIVPVVEVFVAKGIPLGTAIAFMMSVVGLSLPEATMLKKVMTWRLVGIFFSTVTLFIILLGYLYNIIISPI